MDPIFIVGVVALFGGMIAARVIGERAQAALSREEKLTLLDAFTKYRTYSSLPVIGVVFAFFGMRYLPGSAVLPCFFALALMFGGYMAWKGRYIHRRLVELGISPAFGKAIRRAQWCSWGGWLVFFVVLTRSLME